MALTAGPAGAIKNRLLKETFGSAAQPSFSKAMSLAVDQSTGDVLVIDGVENTISRFKPDGTPDNFSALGTNVIDGSGSGDETPQNGLTFANPGETQIAVDNSGTATDGNIYVTQSSPNLINIFAKTGAYLGQLTAAGATEFSEACGVAVDPSGAVYVGDYNSGIHKFVPAANPPLNTDNTDTFTSVENPCTLAAGAGPTAGFLFASTYSGPISKLDSSSGELKYVVSPNLHTTLSVDPATGHVFGATIRTINEFDASGAGSATDISSTPLSNFIHGVAVRAFSSDVYASRFGGANVEVFGTATITLPDVTTTAATAITPTSATLNGTVNPDGAPLTECLFEVGPPKADPTEVQKYDETAPCVPNPAGIGTGTSPVAVHADLSGLDVGGVYHYRLKAVNEDATIVGGDMSLQTLGPVIAAAWSEDVVRSEAVLKAEINPEGVATTYHFEWGTTTAYGQESPESAVGSDSSSREVSRFLEGLQPDTTYHYRVVATSSVAVNEGADHTFTTYPPFVSTTNCSNQAFRGGFSAPLPDCRAYEMVSPLDKNGGDIITESSFQNFRTAHNQVSIDGNKFTYTSYRAFGDQTSSRYANQYLASRGVDGWTSHGINAPQGTTVFDPHIKPFTEYQPNFLLFSDDLSSAWLKDFSEAPITPAGQPGVANIYRRDNITGAFEAITINPPLGPVEKDMGKVLDAVEVQGVSADGIHTIFMAATKLTPDAAANTNRQLYDFTGGEIKLVSVLPDGSANLDEANLGQYNASSGLGGSHINGTRSHAISDDGSRIFWTGGDEFGRGPIYVRINGETTVPVSAGLGLFWTATPDGSKALYSTAGSSPGAPGELYEFDVDTETRRLIAQDVIGVMGASDDLSHIYFVSKEALAPGATAGEVTLYLEREGTTTLVTTVADRDVGVETETSLVSPSRLYRSSRVTPDGLHIAFTSYRSLTGYDNADAVNGKTSKEVFTYDAGADLLTCASCNPSGARPVGQPAMSPFNGLPGQVLPAEWTAAWLTTAPNSLQSPQALTDDGSRLFFNSFDALVPGDTNGAQDVYQWEEQGTGTCDEVGGCISLISTGQSQEKSEFVDATPDGGDVFIETSSSIHPEDPGLIDIYDARAGGGVPPPPPPPTPCVGDACQSVPAAPNDATPASANFRGAGDPAVKKPRRRCVARKRQGAKKSKSHSKRTQAKRCKRVNRGAGR